MPTAELSQRIEASVRGFLQESGQAVSHLRAPLQLRSVEYLTLLLHVEQELNTSIDDMVFFGDDLPETLEDICSRLAQASAQKAP